MSNFKFALLLTLLLTLALSGICQPSPATDPNELVTAARPFDSVDERTMVLGLLEKARQNSSLHGPGNPPYTIRVSFTAQGPVSYIGAGEMQEIYIAMGRVRWTARLAGYSLDRLFQDMKYFDQTPGPMPLRLQMARGAVFNPMPGNWAHRALRVASVATGGEHLICVLLGGMNTSTDTGSRRWNEAEYCVDTASGLLQRYSPAPGLYASYDYRNAVQFGGRTLPRTITFTQGSESPLQIKIESLTDPTADEKGAFSPTPEMLSHAPGPLVMGPIDRFSQLEHSATQSVKPVIVHASIDATGKVLEAEALTSGGSPFAQAAVNAVKQTDYSRLTTDAPNVQHEAFIHVQLAPGP